MVRVFSSFFSYIGSGWVFFFRFPSISLSCFHPTGIVFGPLYQAIFYWLGAVALSFVLPLPWFHCASVLAMALLALAMGFFHEDGFADVADSMGVPYYGPDSRERILSAMKDSRLGTFGVSALLGLWLVRLGLSLENRRGFFALALLVFASRGLGLCIGYACARWGAHHGGAAKVSGLLAQMNGLAVGALGCLSLLAFLYVVGSLQCGLAAFASCSLCSYLALKGLQKRTGIFVGDMVGAIILSIELAFFLLVAVLDQGAR